MSCFVIEKDSYAKAAGIVAGIADAANKGNGSFWLYDRKKGRNMTDKDYLEAFTKVYQMNISSVSESWKENLEADGEDYTKDFLAGKKIGTQAWRTRWGGGYIQIVHELNAFFQSVRYQLDNREIEKTVSAFLNTITVKLFEQIDPNNTSHDSYGSLDLTTF